MSLLGLLNFVLLQWFCIRLQVSFSRACPPGRRHRWWDHEIAADDEVSFSLLRWVVPLTGWWSSYRYFTRAWVDAWLHPLAWFNFLIAQWFFVRLSWGRVETWDKQNVRKRFFLIRWVWPWTGHWPTRCVRFVGGVHLNQQGQHTAKDCT